MLPVTDTPVVVGINLIVPSLSFIVKLVAIPFNDLTNSVEAFKIVFTFVVNKEL